MDGRGSRSGAGRGQFRGGALFRHRQGLAKRACAARKGSSSGHDGVGLSRWEDVPRCRMHLHPRQDAFAIGGSARSVARRLCAVYQVHEEVFESESVVIGQLQPYSKVKWAGETHMAQMSPKVAEVLDKALELSSHERGLLIDRLVESLDEAPRDEGVDAAWADEIKRRVDEIRSGKVKMIPGEEVLRELAKEFPDE